MHRFQSWKFVNVIRWNWVSYFSNFSTTTMDIKVSKMGHFKFNSTISIWELKFLWLFQLSAAKVMRGVKILFSLIQSQSDKIKYLDFIISYLNFNPWFRTRNVVFWAIQPPEDYIWISASWMHHLQTQAWTSLTSNRKIQSWEILLKKIEIQTFLLLKPIK